MEFATYFREAAGYSPEVVSIIIRALSALLICISSMFVMTTITKGDANESNEYFSNIATTTIKVFASVSLSLIYLYMT
jgi:hypothetical protein